MDIFSAATGIGRRVGLAIREAGSDTQSVAEAADITASELEDRLHGRVPFELAELVAVGGFLRIPAQKFLEAAA